MPGASSSSFARRPMSRWSGSKFKAGNRFSLLRAQLIRQLRQELGSESVRRAGELVRAHVADPQAQSATVDRFLDELDSMAPAAFAPEPGSDLRSASREAQAAVVEKFDAVSSGLSARCLVHPVR